MNVGKGVGSDGILIELSKSLEDEEISWFIRLFNRLLHLGKCQISVKRVLSTNP